MNLEYDLQSFMRDLSYIREQTFKESTIIHAFQKAGIWLVDCSIALMKLHTYSQPISTPRALPLRPSISKPSTFKDSE